MRVLIVDDEKNLRESLAKIVKADGWEAIIAADGLEAQQILQRESFDLVVADLFMPGLTGLGLLQWCRESGPPLPFVMISAHAGISEAVEAMRQGAEDFICKPFEPAELILRMTRAVEADRHRRLVQGLPKPDRGQKKSNSRSMDQIEKLLAKVAPSTSLVLISGESGTGKEVLARRIHQISPRRDGPFVGINLGGIPESLLESELFGYEKGAFTGADKRKLGLFETAANGTVFLDEIGEMPLLAQVKLLRVIQERTVQRLGGVTPIPIDARIITATNRDLAEEVKAGRFREDLYYRLHVVPIHLPPLRKRLEDIPHLAKEILESLGRHLGKGTIELSNDAMAVLLNRDYPGNIRELANLLERAALFASDNTIQAMDFELPGSEGSTELALKAEARVQTIADMEKAAILISLCKNAGNQTLAANELGISRRTLFSKLKAYGVNTDT